MSEIISIDAARPEGTTRLEARVIHARAQSAQTALELLTRLYARLNYTDRALLRDALATVRRDAQRARRMHMPEAARMLTAVYADLAALDARMKREEQR